VAEIGYDRLTIDAVAARARAGKATVYRRWASKAELIVDAFVCDAFEVLNAPDTGTLRSDLLALSEHMWMRSGPVPRATVMTGIMSAVLANPELREAFQAASRPPDSVVSAVIRRAVERGEIPEPEDLDVVGTVMPSMCLFHLVKTGVAPDAEFFETVVDRIILPALRYRGRATAEGTSDVRHR
jgi:AcrR family transcriptional regulator